MAFHTSCSSKGSTPTCSALWRRLTSSRTGSPVVTVPCSVSRHGLPIGLQPRGCPFDQARMLNLAHAYAHSTPIRTTTQDCNPSLPRIPSRPPQPPPRGSKDKSDASQHPQWRSRGEMDIRDRVRLVAQSRFEKELRLFVLGIGQVLKHQERLEISWPKLVRQAEAGNQVDNGIRLGTHAPILSQVPFP